MINCRVRFILFLGLAAAVACGTRSGDLNVQENSSTALDATYSSQGQWARAHVVYTPSSTFYEITTSTGTVVVRTGTSLDARTDAPKADPRRVDDVVQLSATDPEYPLVAGLFDELTAAGASSKPRATETGTTLYGAAFFAAKALGRVPVKTPGDPVAAIKLPGTVWPYPGYYDKELLPAELRAAGQQNGNGSHNCCGPYTCANGDWNPNMACDDWCAAGDMCNYNGWGNCGTAMYFPSGGCNNCPHSDSATIKGKSPAGCNNGTCNPRCWEPTPTHNGPASNFDYYGNVNYGSQGGEYGGGGKDYCGGNWCFGQCCALTCWVGGGYCT